MSSVIKSAPDNELRFVLLGKTGVGKSRVGNTLLGIDDFTFAADSSSVTKVCKLKSAVRFGRKIDVVDTPGVFDTDRDNLTVQKEICRCISMTTPGPHAILFCLNMNRSTVQELEALKHYIRHFGKYLKKYLVFVFTHLDTWEDDYTDKKEEIPLVDVYIQDLPKYITSYLSKCGNRYICFNNRAMPSEKDEMTKNIIGIVETMITNNTTKFYSDEKYKEAEDILQSMIDVKNIRDQIKQSDSFLEKLQLKFKLFFINLSLKWKQKGSTPPDLP